jgi:uncharacterized membrane protein SpoIIM required for sporulation
VLYRKAASSLAVARETSLDAATLDYLEALVRRAALQVSRAAHGRLALVRRFLGGGWARAVRAIWLDICIALAVCVAGAVAGWLLVENDEDWYYALVPDGFGDAASLAPAARRSPRTLKAQENAEGLTVFATYLFSNNTGVSIMAFALGFAFGVPTLLLLVHNLAVLGAMVWLFDRAGLGVDFAAWLSVHGTTELLAIVLAGAAGLHIGRAMAFPGERTVLAAAQEAGHRAATVMAGVVLMLVCAGLLEGFVRELLEPTPRASRSAGDAGAVDRLFPARRAAAGMRARADTRGDARADHARRAGHAGDAGRPRRARRGAGARPGDHLLRLRRNPDRDGDRAWHWQPRDGRQLTGRRVGRHVLIIAFFLSRYAYFLVFELGPRGATPGKRALGIRVAARAGAVAAGG